MKTINGREIIDKVLLNDTVWDDMRIPVLSTKIGTSKEPGFAQLLDDGAGSQGVFTYLFSDTIEEELYFMVQMPHSYKLGTAIHPHVHWAPVVNGGANEVDFHYEINAMGSDSEYIK